MMTKKDALGDRMKWYEERATNQTFMPMVPVIARLDGRSFHNFTKGLKRPYDEGMANLMVETTKFLVNETNARCGYTQSDEISLVWLAEEWGSEIFFAGKLQKMNSILSSMTSVFFNKNLATYLPEKANQSPLFDCRIFQVPSDVEAVNCLIWREKDATRNSVSMAAQANFSHRECQNKNRYQLQEMLFSKGINWNDYPTFFKRGTYVRRKMISRQVTATELSELPAEHYLHKYKDLSVKRPVIVAEDFPPLTQIANRTEVILYKAEPILAPEAGEPQLEPAKPDHAGYLRRLTKQEAVLMPDMLNEIADWIELH